MIKKYSKDKLINFIIDSAVIFVGLLFFYLYISFESKMKILTNSINSFGYKESLNIIIMIKNINSFFIFYLSLLFFVMIILFISLKYIFKLYNVTKKNSLFDFLTKVYSKKAVYLALTKELKKSERHNYKTSVAMIDIDFFKKYNDSNGHIAGDELLKKFSKILRDNVREYDIVGRFGGEEFLIVFPETKVKEAFIVCERIRKKVEETKFHGQKRMPFKKITISIGISETNGKGKINANSLIRKADKFLYKAKESGRNKVIYR